MLYIIARMVVTPPREVIRRGGRMSEDMTRERTTEDRGAHTYNRPRSPSPLSASVIDEPWLALVRPANSPRRRRLVSARLHHRTIFFPRFAKSATVWGESLRDCSDCADFGRSRERGTKISEGENRVEFISRDETVGQCVGAPYFRKILTLKKRRGRG